MPSPILALAISKTVHLLFLNFRQLRKISRICCQRLCENRQLLMWSRSLSTYCDPLQLHGKLSGFSKILSIFILDTKVLKLNISLGI